VVEDQAAGGLGCGVVHSGIVSASLGTSGVCFAFSEHVHTTLKDGFILSAILFRGAWHVMGVMLSAGGSLQCSQQILSGRDC
jgi:xylulokinase